MPGMTELMERMWSAVDYEVMPAAVSMTLHNVRDSADSARSSGVSTSSQGQSLTGMWGSAQDVADAFKQFWEPRSESGVRGADYTSGCVAAVNQAAQAVSDGDELMRQNSVHSDAEANAVQGFGGKWAV